MVNAQVCHKTAHRSATERVIQFCLRTRPTYCHIFQLAPKPTCSSHCHEIWDATEAVVQIPGHLRQAEALSWKTKTKFSIHFPLIFQILPSHLCAQL